MIVYKVTKVSECHGCGEETVGIFSDVDKAKDWINYDIPDHAHPDSHWIEEWKLDDNGYFAMISMEE